MIERMRMGEREKEREREREKEDAFMLDIVNGTGVFQWRT